jgi:hypothetical protein
VDREGRLAAIVSGERMAFNDYEERLVANIAEHGWFCVSVLGDASQPSFSYSVGFAETLNAPEFIVFGLPSELMHAMLWEMFRKLEGGGSIPENGDRIAGVLEGYDCLTREVHPENVVREYLNSAIWRWGDPALKGDPLKVRQLFWPDVTHGLFPWEGGCEPEVRAAQPLLYLPPKPKGLASRISRLFRN